MENREPLRPGRVITMPNGGKYVICEKIGEGGLSLVYAAKTKGNEYPVIVKEFFPSKHARRAARTEKTPDGKILRRKGCVCPEEGFEERFEQCLRAFAREGRLGSTAHLQNFQIISFSDCSDTYAILPRWSSDICSLEQLVHRWSAAPPASDDPFFQDLGRVRFALAITGSLLNAVASVHAQNMLHLDLSPRNVVWAGQSGASERNGAAFLTDFGCSVLLEDGAYPAEYVLSYSREYAAPEYVRPGGALDRTTDLYAVGRLLAFLCRGVRAFDAHTSVRRELSRLRIPKRHLDALLTLLETATQENQADRYASAKQMHQAVDALLEALTHRPVNPDNSQAFTLYSLKNMLEGSQDTRYSWAQELCDRRNVNFEPAPELREPVAFVPDGRFPDDQAFLRALLPAAMFARLQKWLSVQPDRAYAMQCVMSGNYDRDLKNELVLWLENPVFLRQLLSSCGALLRNKAAFDEHMRTLLHLPGQDIAYFRKCWTVCLQQTQTERHKELALLAIFALLGQGDCGFESFCGRSPRGIDRLLRA